MAKNKLNHPSNEYMRFNRAGAAYNLHISEIKKVWEFWSRDRTITTVKMASLCKMSTGKISTIKYLLRDAGIITFKNRKTNTLIVKIPFISGFRLRPVLSEDHQIIEKMNKFFDPETRQIKRIPLIEMFPDLIQKSNPVEITDISEFKNSGSRA